MNYPLLYTELQDPELVALSADAAAAKLNQQNLTKLVDTPRQVVNNYAQNASINIKLHAITLQPPSAALDTPIPELKGLTVRLVAYAGIDFFAIDTGAVINPNNEKIKAFIGVLKQSNQFTQEDVDAFWDVFRIHYSRAEEILGEQVTALDVETARLQPEVEEAEALSLRVARSFNRIRGHLAALEEKRAKGESAPVSSWADVTELWGQE